MPSQQEVKWSQLKVGIIVLVSVCLLSSLLFLMSSASGMDVFSKKITLTAYFDNSGGLKVGAPVDLEGVTIGEVKKVQIVNDPLRKGRPVQVLMKIDPRFQKILHKDSTAALSTVGVLGDTIIDIDSEKAVGPEIQTGDEMRIKSSSSINDLVDSAHSTMDDTHSAINDLHTIVKDIKDGNGTVSALIKERALYDNANKTMADLQALSSQMRSGDNSVALLLKDRAVFDNLKATSANLKDITDKMDKGNGAVSVLLNDPDTGKRLKDISKNLDLVLADAQNGKGTVGVLLKDPVFASHLSDTMSNVDALTQGLKDGNGTLGKTVVNLDQTLSATQDLLKAFEANPKKYLTIQMKIF